MRIKSLKIDASKWRSDMELKDTVDLMLSEDYRDRFKAEYQQVKIRKEKLEAYIKKIVDVKASHEKYF